jgi:hypothetical protein
MLKATRPTASSIQFWEQTEHQKLVDQPVLQGSPQATIYGQQPVVNGYFARDHYACDFAASRASRVLRKAGGSGNFHPKKHNAAQAEYDRLAALV